MPYVNQGRRDHLDPYIQPIIGRLWMPGDLSYVIARLAASKVSEGSNFADRVKVYAELQASADEYYRRVIAPYEDQKCKQNGDVYALQDHGGQASLSA